MLNKIIRFSLNNKLFVLLGVVLLTVGGLYTMQQMDVDVFPDLTAPTVVVMTDAHGLSAEEVERLVTFPIETAVNGATDVRRVRSASLQGSSFVWVEFDWGADIFKARQIVSEKMVTLTGALPAGIVPVLAPQSSVMGEILFVGLQTDGTDAARKNAGQDTGTNELSQTNGRDGARKNAGQDTGTNELSQTNGRDGARPVSTEMDLRTLADWTVKPAILADRIQEQMNCHKPTVETGRAPSLRKWIYAP